MAVPATACSSACALRQSSADLFLRAARQFDLEPSAAEPYCTVRTLRARCLTGKSISAVQPRLQKYCASSETQINFRTPAILSHTEGRIAIVTDVGHGMRWTRQHQARNSEFDE